MIIFRRTPTGVKVRLPSADSCMGIIESVTPRAAQGIHQLDRRIAELEAENDALVQSAEALHEAAKREHHRQAEHIERLKKELGRVRDDMRVLARRYAGHMNVCAQLAEVDQEDAAKARSR